MRGAEVDQIRRELQCPQRARRERPALPRTARSGSGSLSSPPTQRRPSDSRRRSTSHGRYPALNVRVGIVDSFQGDEDQVVILSIAATTVAGFLKTPEPDQRRGQPRPGSPDRHDRAASGLAGGSARRSRVARFIVERVNRATRPMTSSPPKPRPAGARP